MEVRRQHIPENRSRHQDAAVCTSQTGARYSQTHSGTGRAVACLAYTGWPWSSGRPEHYRCTGSCKGRKSVCSRLAGGSAASAAPPMQEWHGHSTTDSSPGERHSSGPAAFPGVQRQTGPSPRVTVVHPGHHQGQHDLDTGVPVQEASDVADGAQVMEHGALDALDLAVHVHDGVHDDGEAAEVEHCMPLWCHQRSQPAAVLGGWSGSAESWWPWTPSYRCCSWACWWAARPWPPPRTSPAAATHACSCPGLVGWTWCAVGGYRHSCDGELQGDARWQNAEVWRTPRREGGPEPDPCGTPILRFTVVDRTPLDDHTLHPVMEIEPQPGQRSPSDAIHSERTAERQPPSWSPCLEMVGSKRGGVLESVDAETGFLQDRGDHSHLEADRHHWRCQRLIDDAQHVR